MGVDADPGQLSAPCTVLDFPTWTASSRRFGEGDYDIVGISSIIPNQLKVKKMCEMVRRHLPHATIVVGGHIANVPDLSERIDADHIVRGEGVAWFRQFLGDDEGQPLRHPLIVSGFGARCMGMSLKGKLEDTAATLIPSVGCPLGCNFCSTSAMFGGKGKSVNFYETGDELFDVMCQMSIAMKVRSFFVMDENFLLHRRRALRLLELMERHQQGLVVVRLQLRQCPASLHHGAAGALGISWVWMGMEGEDSPYTKLNGVDTLELVRELQSHGIRVLGSTIIGLEDHTPENIDRAIEHAVRHDTDFHQFMLYTPIPGTPCTPSFRRRVECGPTRNVTRPTCMVSRSSTTDILRCRGKRGRIDCAGIHSRIRGERTERGTDRRNDAGGLEPLPNSSRTREFATALSGKRGLADGVHGDGGGRQALLPRSAGDMRQAGPTAR